MLEQAQKSAFFGILAVTALGGVYYITQILPGQLPGDFRIDYDMLGVMLPVMIWVGRNKWQSLGMCAFGLILMGMENSIQMYAVLALIPLAMYNGQRGKHNMKGFFYWYYPVHLVAIYGIAYLLENYF